MSNLREEDSEKFVQGVSDYVKDFDGRVIVVNEVNWPESGKTYCLYNTFGQAIPKPIVEAVCSKPVEFLEIPEERNNPIPTYFEDDDEIFICGTDFDCNLSNM